MEISNHILISGLLPKEVIKVSNNFNSIIWIKEKVDEFLIDGVSYHDLSQKLIFLNNNHDWKISKIDNNSSAGYVIYISDTVMEEPFLNSIRISKIHSNYTHNEFLSVVDSDVETKLQSIVNMLQQLLLNSCINYRDVAIIGLINTFFIYANSLSVETTENRENDRKAVLVHQFLRLLSSDVTEYQRVSLYADRLNISSAYLNECTRDVVGISAKSMIIRQLIVRTKNELKLTEKSTKEIAYELGFSSPDYFSSFCKKHIGVSPSKFRKA